MCKNCRHIVRTRNIETSAVTTVQELRQGSELAPTLFILIMDDVKETRAKVSKLYVRYRKLSSLGIRECVFADDVAIFTKNEKGLQKNIMICNEAMDKRNIKINKKKETKIVGSNKMCEHPNKWENDKTSK